MKTDYLLWPRIKAGHYAIPDASGVLKFYEVARPEPPSRWAGWLFLSVCASDDRYPIKGQAERERIFHEISKDPLAALKRYGQEIGRCGHCGRTLTDATSRALGIGPVCRGDLGL
jgi:hypothetical protein